MPISRMLTASACLALLALASPTRGQVAPGAASSTTTQSAETTPTLKQFAVEEILPAETEVLINLNVRRLIDSGLLQRFLEANQRTRQARLFEQMTGTNPLRDIDRVHFFGRVNDDENVGIILEGKFDRQKLLTLIQANLLYKETPMGGTTVYQWEDDKEQRMKFGTFLGERSLVIWNSEAACQASLAAAQDAARRLSRADVEKLIPPGAGDKVGWGMLITRQADCPGAKLQVASAAAVGDVADNLLNMDVTINGMNEEANRHWQSVLAGLVAFGQLQQKRPALAEIARRAQLTTAAGGGAAMKLSLDQAMVLELARVAK